MSYSFKKSLSILTDYAEGQGFTVNLDYHDISTVKWRGLNEPRKILIEGNNTLESKVYLFLHELGHNELRKDWAVYERVMPVAAYADVIKLYKYRRRIEYYICTIEEEFKAWDAGFVLGQRLGIRINKKHWNDLRNKSLMSYIRYFGNKK